MFDLEWNKIKGELESSISITSTFKKISSWTSHKNVQNFGEFAVQQKYYWRTWILIEKLSQISLFIVAVFASNAMALDDHLAVDVPEPAVNFPLAAYGAEKCALEEKSRVVLSDDQTSITKIVIPFDTELLSRCSVQEIVDITTEKDNIELLKKLLKFAQRYKL